MHHVGPAEGPGVRARRRRVALGTVLLGTALLGRSLSRKPGSTEFYVDSLVVAGVWTAGGVLSGPLHLGWIESRDDRLRRPVLTPIATGVAAFGVFYVAALVVRQVPVLNRALTRVLAFADEGQDGLVLVTTLANGVAEEVFFRGALYAASEQHPVATSTAVYAAATASTRNPALVLAAIVMGTLFGLQRRASGGLQASTLTHLTWSTLMLRYLPRLFRPLGSNLYPSDTVGGCLPVAMPSNPPTGSRSSWLRCSWPCSWWWC